MADPLKFYLITDLHHYAPSLGTSGKAMKSGTTRNKNALPRQGRLLMPHFQSSLQTRTLT